MPTTLVTKVQYNSSRGSSSGSSSWVCCVVGNDEDPGVDWVAICDVWLSPACVALLFLCTGGAVFTGAATLALGGTSAGSMRRKEIANLILFLSWGLKIEGLSIAIDQSRMGAYLRLSKPVILLSGIAASSARIFGVTHPLSRRETNSMM
jgi:hypothetical protein